MIKIINPDKKSITRKLLFIFGGFTVTSVIFFPLIILFPDVEKSKIFGYIMGGCFIVSTGFAVYGLYFLNTFSVIGELKLGKTHLTILNEKISIGDIDQIRISVKNVYGDPGRTFSINEGGYNDFIISLKNGTSKKYYLSLEKRIQLKYITKMAEYYKAEGIDMIIMKNSLIA